ncbi:hypothetical protein POM88_045248 [Heracleum sosnowskyi]|uniref:Uncharacterized protein n=1 Tax=Heracleum sosnowskyi TaxID=360622 RepID=A0AAD8H5E2_9APIA|nr:hypothetical protein POM88_045248 [Heracleum sosnowskyi]
MESKVLFSASRLLKKLDVLGSHVDQNGSIVLREKFETYKFRYIRILTFLELELTQLVERWKTFRKIQKRKEWSSISSKFCGGTDISYTRKAKAFALSEKGIANGIHRITAITKEWHLLEQEVWSCTGQSRNPIRSSRLRAATKNPSCIWAVQKDMQG